MAPSPVVVALIAALAPGAAEALVKHHHGEASGTLATVEMHMHKADCGRKSKIASHGALARMVKAKTRNPGAGIDQDSLTPFETVLKDGFYSVDCVKDMMFANGDKYGDNRFEYNLADIANVSIVHYAAMVPQEDRESMSHEVCFDFCRTIPGMNFFGLQNGRACYCAPYYEAMADDSSMCDAVCEGNPTTMCGGKSKSSIFGMHQCDSTAADLSTVKGKVTDVAADLSAVHETVANAATDMQVAADHYQPLFGSAGDPVASELFQSAKSFAGDLERAAGQGGKLMEKSEGMSTEADGMAGLDFTKSENAKKAESLIGEMEEYVAQAAASTDELEKLRSDVSPELDGSEEGASARYYPVMYFVDKEVKAMPSTCGGTASGRPMLGSMDACSRYCDANRDAKAPCVAYSFYPEIPESTETGICFLLSKIASATYYTKCDEESTSGFLQRASMAGNLGVNVTAVQCRVKFSDFSGTTLKPDPSGKCKNCLKEVTKAERCFQNM